jgi:N-acetylmuramoyl-L-alanine amidase
VARWNGVEIWLGLPPRLIDGHPCVSGLDAEKSLEPLLTGFPRVAGPRPTIVLDPGHGGAGQPGAKSILYNRFEKEYTLDWARKLAALLSPQGWNVVLTRTDDTDVSLSNRVAVAQTEGADLFVSLHFNSSYPRTDQSGIETYCMTPAGMPSSITRSYGDDPRAVTANNAFDRENLQLAALLHRGILEATGAPDRGVRRARFMGVLKGQNRPSVLIEGGYLSNPREAGLIASPAYRQRLAAGAAEALARIRASGMSAVTQK